MSMPSGTYDKSPSLPAVFASRMAGEGAVTLCPAGHGYLDAKLWVYGRMHAHARSPAARAAVEGGYRRREERLVVCAQEQP